MPDWGIALMTACAALAGSLVTGWYTRAAGGRQADAARHAGNRQADAVLETVRMTLQDQRSVRELDLRRGAYAEFLAAAEVLVLTRRTRVGDPADLPALRRAFSAVLLEGPADAARTARELVDLLGTGHGSLDTIEQRREAFVAAAQQALRPADPAPPPAARAGGGDPSAPPR
ncbi:hypothetical protein [Streptacidiphilus carbonis]|uniref:hypothetical protein n=1 Tax=Streptacidiphilus carbonis TaxID=105422 RepID=UPI0005AA36F9|nr:hypothetical protein [Streptacidiphilus carbonis]